MLSAHRYVAYTSDIGESFRPIAHPYLVRGAYAVSWAYLIGDVSNEGWKAHKRNQRLLNPIEHEQSGATAKDMPATKAVPSPQAIHIPAIESYQAVMAQRAVFQSLASMGLPAFTIHSIVRYSGRALKNASNATIRTWGPIGVSTHTRPQMTCADYHLARTRCCTCSTLHVRRAGGNSNRMDLLPCVQSYRWRKCSRAAACHRQST